MEMGIDSDGDVSRPRSKCLPMLSTYVWATAEKLSFFDLKTHVARSSFQRFSLQSFLTDALVSSDFVDRVKNAWGTVIRPLLEIYGRILFNDQSLIITQKILSVDLPSRVMIVPYRSLDRVPFSLLNIDWVEKREKGLRLLVFGLTSPCPLPFLLDSKILCFPGCFPRLPEGCSLNYPRPVLGSRLILRSGSLSSSLLR